MRFISIDPGLDDVRIARWDAPDRQGRGVHAGWVFADYQQKLACLVDVVSVKTDPKDPVEDRLQRIGDLVDDERANWRTRMVVLERPGIGGVYRRNTGEAGTVGGRRAETLLTSHWALGAIVGAQGVRSEMAVKVRLVKPESTKAKRSSMLQMYMDAAGRKLLKNQDVRDAIWVGLQTTWDFNAWGTIDGR